MRRLMRDVGEWVEGEEEGRMWEEGGRERRVSRVERDRRERIRIEWMEEERERVSFPSGMKKKKMDRTSATKGETLSTSDATTSLDSRALQTRGVQLTVNEVPSVLIWSIT